MSYNETEIQLDKSKQEGFPLSSWSEAFYLAILQSGDDMLSILCCFPNRVIDFSLSCAHKIHYIYLIDFVCMFIVLTKKDYKSGKKDWNGFGNELCTSGKIRYLLTFLVFLPCVSCLDSLAKDSFHSFPTLTSHRCNREIYLHNKTCPTPTYFDSLIDHCEFRCDTGSQPHCLEINKGIGSVYICLKAGKKVPAGFKWELYIDEKNLLIVNVRQTACTDNHFQAEATEPKDSLDGCKDKHADISLLSKEFEVSKIGDYKTPTMVHCNFNEGYYSIKNTSEFDYDLTVFGNMASAFCTDTKYYNPCSKGQMVLHNGTCVPVCRNGLFRDYFSNFTCKPKIDASRTTVTVYPKPQLSVAQTTGTTSTDFKIEPLKNNTVHEDSINTPNVDNSNVLTPTVATVVTLAVIILGVLFYLLYLRRKISMVMGREGDDAENKRLASNSEDTSAAVKNSASSQNSAGESRNGVDEELHLESEEIERTKVIRIHSGNEAKVVKNNGYVHQYQNCRVEHIYQLIPTCDPENRLNQPEDKVRMQNLSTKDFEETDQERETNITMERTRRKSYGFDFNRISIVNSSANLFGPNVAEELVLSQEGHRSVDGVSSSGEQQTYVIDAIGNQPATDSNCQEDGLNVKDLGGISAPAQKNTPLGSNEFCALYNTAENRTDTTGNQQGRYVPYQESLADSDVVSNAIDETSSAANADESSEHIVLGNTEIMSPHPSRNNAFIH